jgi:hypothetical protein
MQITLGVAADIEEEIGPVADVVFGIVSLTLFARNFFRFAVCATVEVDVTTRRNGELSEGKFAVGRQVGRNH